MGSNRLQLNKSKTEVMWVGSSRRQNKLPTSPFRVGDCEVTPVSTVRDLGIYLDSDTSMSTHISSTVSTCFGVLRVLKSLLHSVPKDVMIKLVYSLVLTRLDYGNATLYGLPSLQLNKIQSVLNAAARMLYGARRCDHISPLLEELHWLRPRERISFKIATLTWRCLHGLGPEYLCRDLHRVSERGCRGGLRSANSRDLVPPRTHNVSHGDRAWPAASAAVWNNVVPENLKSEEEYLTFRRLLKNHLWSKSYPPA